MIGRLVSNNPAKAKDVELSSERKEIILGRSASCTVKLDDTRCSSNHCKISFELISNEWAFTIEDLSTNGTFLNGQKVKYK
jgi:pSer/pThr/pTyr-binding forkhead associated (FHA) protein